MKSPHHAPSPSVAFESTDVKPGPVLAAVGVVVLALLLALGAMALWLRPHAGLPRDEVETATNSFIHGPADTSSIAQSWQSIDARRAAEADAPYGWIDREHGVVRIPVERAMALIAQESEGRP